MYSMKVHLNNPITNIVTTSSLRKNETTFDINKVLEDDSKKAEIELSRRKHAEFIQSTMAILNENSPSELVDSKTNTIHIEKGVYYSLGTVNGKPLNATPLTSGGVNSNFSPKLYVKPGSAGMPVTSEQLYSSKVFQSYTEEEHKEANQIIGVFLALELVGNGTLSVNNFNEKAATYFPQFAEGIGLDLDKPFSINGKVFEFKDGELNQLKIEE